MIFSGSIVTIEKGSLDAVKFFLSGFPQVEIYQQTDDGQQLVIVIETEDDKALEALCLTLKENPQILDVAHHYFNFEEEVEEIRITGKKPDLRGIGKMSGGKNFN